jgi:hypothetical protein
MELRLLGSTTCSGEQEDTEDVEKRRQDNRQDVVGGMERAGEERPKYYIEGRVNRDSPMSDIKMTRGG